jgi:hypothetical protein
MWFRIQLITINADPSVSTTLVETISRSSLVLLIFFKILVEHIYYVSATKVAVGRREGFQSTPLLL